MKSRLRVAISFAIVLYSVGSAFSFAGSLWAFDLLSHFRVHAVGLGVLLGLTALVLGARRFAGLTLGVIFSHAVPIVGLYMGGPQPLADPDKAVEALVFNVNFNGDPAAVTALLEANIDVPIVGLLEITNAWYPKMAATFAKWPHRLEVRRDDAFGMILLSRFPLERDPRHTTSLPIIHAKVRAPGTAPFSFVLLHLIPPMDTKAAADRNNDVKEIIDRAGATRAVIAGDFNASPWSVAFAPIQASDLQLMSQGMGPQPTWPSRWGFLGISIDHALVTSDIEIGAFEVLEDAGSDHRPIKFSFVAP